MQFSYFITLYSLFVSYFACKHNYSGKKRRRRNEKQWRNERVKCISSQVNLKIIQIEKHQPLAMHNTFSQLNFIAFSEKMSNVMLLLATFDRKLNKELNTIY